MAAKRFVVVNAYLYFQPRALSQKFQRATVNCTLWKAILDKIMKLKETKCAHLYLHQHCIIFSHAAPLAVKYRVKRIQIRPVDQLESNGSLLSQPQITFLIQKCCQIKRSSAINKNDIKTFLETLQNTCFNITNRNRSLAPVCCAQEIPSTADNLERVHAFVDLSFYLQVSYNVENKVFDNSLVSEQQVSALQPNEQQLDSITH